MRDPPRSPWTKIKSIKHSGGSWSRLSPRSPIVSTEVSEAFRRMERFLNFRSRKERSGRLLGSEPSCIFVQSTSVSTHFDIRQGSEIYGFGLTASIEAQARIWIVRTAGAQPPGKRYLQVARTIRRYQKLRLCVACAMPENAASAILSRGTQATGAAQVRAVEFFTVT